MKVPTTSVPFFLRFVLYSGLTTEEVLGRGCKSVCKRSGLGFSFPTPDLGGGV